MTIPSLKKLVREGKPIINGWLAEASALKAEIMSKAGYHSITVDLQHGLQDYSHMLQAFYGMKGTNIVPMARVPWNHPDEVMKALDAGAIGIICPMINNKQEAEKFASSLFYPPKGDRSYGPVRADIIYDDYFQNADAEIVGFAMIETKEAVKNIDEILSVPSINGVYIGPADLSISHGFKPGFDREEPEILKIIEMILKKAKDKKAVAGIHTISPEYAIKMIELGFDMVTLSSDMLAMERGLQDTMSRLSGYRNG